MGGALEDPDRALLEEMRRSPAGDLRPFEQLVRRYQEKIVTNCRYIARSANDAEDLAQEVFLKVFFALPAFEGRSTFRTWIQRIKINHCLNHLKKTAGASFVDIDDLEGVEPEAVTTAPLAAARLESTHERQRIDETLDRMSDTLRVPLILCDMDELSYQEIAETLGIGLSAVKMRIKRARGEFQRLYAPGPRATPETATNP